MYDVKSKKAEEFISHDEILETLSYAEKNRENRALIESIIEKARLGNGLSHREAAVLLDCGFEDLNEKIYKLAEEIKERFYGTEL